MTPDQAEHIAAQLEATGDYRVLRRLKPRTTINAPDGSPTRIGIFFDLETTGLDPSKDEIIEMAMIPFTYSVDGRIFELEAPFDRLRQPATPIHPEITAITGISNEMVMGKTIDLAEVDAFIRSAALVIAHNAGFDRPFAELHGGGCRWVGWLSCCCGGGWSEAVERKP